MYLTPSRILSVLRSSSWKIYFARNQSLLLLVTSLFVLSLTVGCDRSAPDDLIDEDQYIKILVEMHLLAAMREMTDDEDRFINGQEAVLKHYNITRKQFERSHDYYFRDPGKQQQRLRDVRRQIEKISSDLSEYELEMRKKRDAESSSKTEADPGDRYVSGSSSDSQQDLEQNIIKY